MWRQLIQQSCDRRGLDLAKASLAERPRRPKEHKVRMNQVLQTWKGALRLVRVPSTLRSHTGEMVKSGIGAVKPGLWYRPTASGCQSGCTYE